MEEGGHQKKKVEYTTVSRTVLQRRSRYLQSIY